MKSRVFLLIALVLLYLIPSLILQGVYGPSYGFLEGDNGWEPDGAGGWVMRGETTDAMPEEPSEYISIWLLYLPIFLPALVLILFLFTPLSRKLEPAGKEPESSPEHTPEESDT